MPDEDSWSNEELQTTEPTDYHQFPLPFSNIHLIDTEESFEQFLDRGLQVRF